MRPASRLPAARSAAWAPSRNTNVTGSGTVSISISNAGTLTASNGTLDLTGTVSGRTLAISSATASVLKIDGTATTAAATSITLNNANQTLEIGAAGNLTISAAQTATAGTIQMDGGSLTDSAGITLTSPADADRQRLRSPPIPPCRGPAR